MLYSREWGASNRCETHRSGAAIAYLDELPHEVTVWCCYGGSGYVVRTTSTSKRANEKGRRSEVDALHFNRSSGRVGARDGFRLVAHRRFQAVNQKTRT